MISIKIEGQDQLTNKLNNALNSLDDLKDIFSDVGTKMVDFFSTEPFLSQGGIYGQRWDKLTPAYLKQKEKKWGGGKGVLVASGEMQNSFVSKPTSMSVVLMNTSHVFVFHQLGTEKMPQRVMMLLDDTRAEMVLDTVAKLLQPKIESAFEE
jgi:phage gpG-like protein